MANVQRQKVEVPRIQWGEENGNNCLKGTELMFEMVIKFWK